MMDFKENTDAPLTPEHFAPLTARLTTFDLQRLRDILARKIALVDEKLQRRGEPIDHANARDEPR